VQANAAAAVYCVLTYLAGIQERVLEQVVANFGLQIITGPIAALWRCQASGAKETSALLGHYAASSGSGLLDSPPLNMRPIVCSETSVSYYQYTLRDSPDKCSSHLVCSRPDTAQVGASSTVFLVSCLQLTNFTPFGFRVSVFLTPE